MIGSIRHQITIDRSADDVWRLVGDPPRLSEWFPDFISSTVEGSTRTVTSASGISIDEELLVVDSILHRLQYRLELPIVTFHRGTIDVIELDEAKSLVVYATDADPRIMAMVIGSATARALREAKRQLEGAT